MSEPIEKPGTSAIGARILAIRGRRVLLDADLATLYGVRTKALNQAVRRNKARFPVDFCFRINEVEKVEVVTTCDHLRKLKYSKTTPLAFTEYGAIMVANILNSPRAVEMAIYVVRAFVELRQVLSSNKELALRLEALEKSVEEVYAAIRALMTPTDTPSRPIGFTADLTKP